MKSLIKVFFLSLAFFYLNHLEAQQWNVGSSTLWAGPTFTRVGIGTSSPSSDYMLHVNTFSKSGIYSYTASSSKSAIHGNAFTGRGVYGVTSSGFGIYGEASSPSGYAGYFLGKLGVTGEIQGLSSASTFDIFANTDDSDGAYLRMYGQGSNDPGRISLVSGDGGSIQFYSRDASSWKQHMIIKNNSKVAIGTDQTPVGLGDADLNPYHLFVAGGILTEEVRVRTGWADYVFEEDYNLMSLSQVKNHIDKHGHLHNTPSAEEVENNGLELKSMTVNQQEKIEELFLHMIELKKEVASLQAKNEQLEKQLTMLENK